MSYEFKKLSEVQAMDVVPEGAKVLAEVNGEIRRVPAATGEGGGTGGGAQLIVTLTEDEKSFSLTERIYSADKTREEILYAINEGKIVYLSAKYLVNIGTETPVVQYGLYTFAGVTAGKPAFVRFDKKYCDIILYEGNDYLISTVDLSR